MIPKTYVHRPAVLGRPYSLPSRSPDPQQRLPRGPGVGVIRQSEHGEPLVAKPSGASFCSSALCPTLLGDSLIRGCYPVGTTRNGLHSESLLRRRAHWRNMARGPRFAVSPREGSNPQCAGPETNFSAGRLPLSLVSGWRHAEQAVPVTRHISRTVAWGVLAVRALPPRVGTVTVAR